MAVLINAQRPREDGVSRRLIVFGATALAVSNAPRASLAQTNINAGAKSAYQAGRWQDAATQAAAQSNPDNQAFAARALLASALLTTNSQARQPAITQALAYAQAALAVAPNHVEGRLQLATALGLQARAMAPARAFARGLPQRVKRLLDGVARDAPAQAWAFALLGGWHLEGLRIGGPAARAMLGCNLVLGKAAFERAMRLDPLEASPPFYFAASLLALAPAANANDAQALLRRATSCPDRDVFQTTVKARAAALAQSIETDGPIKGAQLALSWL
jgi:hypothetical protein